MKPARPFGPAPEGRTRLRRTASVLVMLAALSIGAAACGGGSPGAPKTTSSAAQGAAGGGPPDPESRQARLLKFAVCMRSHGVPNFPDPRNGFLNPPAGMSPTSPQFQSARQSCQSLLPGGGSQGVTSPQNLAGLAKFAACMTKHGVPMSASGNGTLTFPNNVDPNSPQFQSGKQACQKLVPEGVP